VSNPRPRTADEADAEQPDETSRAPSGGAPAGSAQAVVEGHTHGTEEPGDSVADAPAPSDRLPPAGPHADPALMNDIATPGTGVLTPVGEHDDVDSTSS
jgi:hypothetical protein